MTPSSSTLLPPAADWTGGHPVQVSPVLHSALVAALAVADGEPAAELAEARRSLAVGRSEDVVCAAGRLRRAIAKTWAGDPVRSSAARRLEHAVDRRR